MENIRPPLMQSPDMRGGHIGGPRFRGPNSQMHRGGFNLRNGPPAMRPRWDGPPLVIFKFVSKLMITKFLYILIGDYFFKLNSALKKLYREGYQLEKVQPKHCNLLSIYL